MSELTIHTDGAARGNPGPAAIGYVIEEKGKLVTEEKEFLGTATNNFAEYTAVVRALEHAKSLGASKIRLYSDSELLVKQMNGVYRVKNATLRPLYEQAQRLRQDFDAVNFHHIPREQNSEADRLCNEALDDPTESRPTRKKSAAPAKPSDEVHERAIALLEVAAERWANGDASNPPANEVWEQLWVMLKEQKVVR